MKLKWTLIADVELLKLTAYIYPRNRTAALKLHQRTRQRIQQLVQFPLSAKPGRIGGTRELVVGKSPYIAVYTVEDGTVTIHHVLHAAQQWPPEEE